MTNYNIVLNKYCNPAIMLLWHYNVINMSACNMLYHGDRLLENLSCLGLH